MTSNLQCRIGWRLMALILATVGASTANAETWAARLDYPADAKVVILHGSELGLSYETNAAGRELFDSGSLRSASGLPTAPWFADYASWAATQKDRDLGLELVLTSPWPKYRWQPVAAGVSLTSLVDADGYLWRTPIQAMVNATAADVEHELEAQLWRAKSLGFHPTHLTTNRGVLFTRLDLAEVYLRFAQHHWLPAVAVELTDEQIERFRRQGFPLPDELIALLADYPLPKLDDLHVLPATESYEAAKLALLELIGKLQPGLTQIAFTPAIESEAMPLIVSDAQQRVWDYRLLQDEEVLAALKQNGVIPTDWREVMARFEGEFTAPPESK